MESRSKPKQSWAGFYPHEWLGKHLKGKWNGLPGWSEGWDFTFQSRFNSGQETKIPHVLWPKNKNAKQKQYCNKFNKDFLKREKHTGCGTLLPFISPSWRKSEFQTSAHLTAYSMALSLCLLLPFWRIRTLKHATVTQITQLHKNGHPMCYCFLSFLGGE